MMMMEVIQDIKVIEVSGFERRMFWYLILLMDPYCAGRGDEASKLKINIASCCLKGPKRRSTNGYCWRRCHHRHCHHDYHLWCEVTVFTSLIFSSWNWLLLMTCDQENQAKRAIDSTPHTLVSYLSLSFVQDVQWLCPRPSICTGTRTAWSAVVATADLGRWPTDHNYPCLIVSFNM